MTDLEHRLARPGRPDQRRAGVKPPEPCRARGDRLDGAAAMGAIGGWKKAARMSEPVPAYFNQINPVLLGRLPANLRLVVELGCAAGALGAAYKAQNPACRWHGVELNEAAAALARQRLDQVTVADLDTQDPLEALDGQPIDALVYGDVLEHLRDPWSVLTRQAARLPAGGLVLACIPNMQHWSLIVRLLRGRWDYVGEGLLDRTHLRWFTPDTMVEMIQAAGLQVRDMVPVVQADRHFDRFLEILRPVLPELGVEAEKFARASAVRQMVITAVKPG